MSSSTRAITRLASGLLIGFVGGIVTAAVTLITMYGSLIKLMIQPSAPLSVSALMAVFNSLTIMLMVGVSITVIAAVIQYLGFAELSSINSRYSTAKIGALLIPVGSIIEVPGIYLFIDTMKELISTNQLNSAPTLGIMMQPITAALSMLIPSIILILVGGILSLVGLILIVIGYYRLGVDYGSDMVRVGAILYILAIIPYVGPFLSLVGIIMMIIGLFQIRQRPVKT
ncbi:MAG: DUF973 family protein [Thermocladium sp.]|jgi:hypothetical protein|nr:MAG: hypothetical protein AT710_01200 [Thermocladium sp. ECH_B]